MVESTQEKSGEASGNKPPQRALEKRPEAESIIRKHVGYAMLSGAVPVPVLDLAAGTAVQLDMLKRLAILYDIEVDGASSKSFLTSLGSAVAGSTAGRGAASLAKSIPFIGWAIGGAASIAANGATTYAIGHTFRRYFEEGRDLESLTLDEAKAEVMALLDRGKEVALDLVKGVENVGAAIEEKATELKDSIVAQSEKGTGQGSDHSGDGDDSGDDSDSGDGKTTEQKDESIH